MRGKKTQTSHFRSHVYLMSPFTIRSSVLVKRATAHYMSSQERMINESAFCVFKFRSCTFIMHILNTYTSDTRKSHMACRSSIFHISIDCEGSSSEPERWCKTGCNGCNSCFECQSINIALAMCVQTLRMALRCTNNLWCSPCSSIDRSYRAIQV